MHVMTAEDLSALRATMLDAALETTTPGEDPVAVLNRAEGYVAYVLQPFICPDLCAAMIGLRAGATVH